MTMSNFALEEGIVKKAPTVVTRLSDKLKDGTHSGPPLLIRHTSMQKICQNLNLFPYLLYSLENSKSHPVAKRVNYIFDLIIRKMMERIAFMYTSIQHMLLSTVNQKISISKPQKVRSEKPRPEEQKKVQLYWTHKKLKPKQISVMLVIAVYLAPLILAMQLVGVGCLLLFGKHTPGFIFLITALFFLGYIAARIMFHSKRQIKVSRQKKRKNE